jgi:hypothetical protein
MKINIQRESVVMVQTRKIYAGMLVSVVLFVFTAGAQAGGSFLLGGMSSAQVFEVTLLWDNGASYRQYVYVDGTQGICEMSAVGEIGRCQIDLIPIAEAFKQIAIVEYLPRLPDSIHWGVETSTPVLLAAVFKEWDSVNQRASQWRVVCSVMPGHEDQTVCLQEDRIDHFNYVLIQTEPLMRLIAGLDSKERENT